MQQDTTMSENTVEVAVGKCNFVNSGYSCRCDVGEHVLDGNMRCEACGHLLSVHAGFGIFPLERDRQGKEEADGLMLV